MLKEIWLDRKYVSAPPDSVTITFQFMLFMAGAIPTSPSVDSNTRLVGRPKPPLVVLFSLRINCNIAYVFWQCGWNLLLRRAKPRKHSNFTSSR